MEPVRSNAAVAGIVGVIVAIVTHFGLHLSVQTVSIITAVVGFLAPVIAGEFSRLKVTPSIKLPSATLRQDLPLLTNVVEGLASTTGAVSAPSEAELASLAEQVLSAPAATPPVTVSPPATGV